MSLGEVVCMAHRDGEPKRANGVVFLQQTRRFDHVRRDVAQFQSARTGQKRDERVVFSGAELAP